MWTKEEIAWQWQGKTVRLGVTRSGAGPTVLLLPALSSISTRHEMLALQERLAERFATVAIDWPGFGDLPRPALAWSPDAYDAFLEHVLAEVAPAPSRRPGRGRCRPWRGGAILPSRGSRR